MPANDPNARSSTRGGDNQPIARTSGGDTDLAHLLVEAMWDTKSSHDGQFRADYCKILSEWRRWLRLMVWWWEQKHGGMPYHDLRNNQQFWDALDCRFSFYPKPKPLSATQVVAYRRRAMIAEATTTPLFRALPLQRIRRGDPAFDWGERLLDSTRRLVLDIYDEVNPAEKKRHPRGLHRAFRYDVAEFCKKWGLRAWWAEPLFIHFLFLSVELKTREPVSLKIRGPFNVATQRLYAPLPGHSAEDVEKSRADLDGLVVLWPQEPGRGFQVIHEPDREEMRQIEIERSSAVVALDWDGDRVGGFRTVLDWAVAEIGHRIGRPLTKTERRELSSYLAPQVRTARKAFLKSGDFEVRRRADVETYAVWCAELLLDSTLTYVDFESRDPYVSADVVRQRTAEFAQRAGLAWPPRALWRDPNAWKARASRNS